MKHLFVMVSIFLMYSSIHGDYALLDSAFGSNGIVITNLGTSSGTVNAEVPTLHIKVQKDGKIIVCGDSYTLASGRPETNSKDGYITVVRYNNDGTLDTSFGAQGVVQVSRPDTWLFQAATDCAVQPDGKIIITGRTWQHSMLNPAATILRLNPDGSLDATFGDGGIIIDKNPSKQWSNFFKVLLQDDGSIIAAGGYGTDMFDSNKILSYTAYVVRYMPDGKLDTHFDIKGGALFGALLQHDGKLVGVGQLRDYSAAGASDTPHCDSFIVCYNADGTLDNSFGSGSNGIIITSTSKLCNYFVDVVETSDNKLIALGTSQHEQMLYGEFCLVRYLPNGNLDTAFGGDGSGIVRTKLGTGNAIAKNIIVQEDGKLLVTGVVQWDTGTQFTIVRYTCDGELDTSFGPDGNGIITLTLRSTPGDDRSFSLAMQHDGKLLIAGDSSQGIHYDFALARYVP